MAYKFLYYGDNLDILRRHVKDESVDLVYLDPPFNSNASYNVLFAAQDGRRRRAELADRHSIISGANDWSPTLKYAR
jgi:16S rRNA G966 N2-methylase RsmD